MSRTCTVCRHPKRGEIDRAITEGAPFRDIANRYGPSKAAVQRHKPHVTARIVKAAESREIVQADSLLDSITTLRTRLERAVDDAKTSRDMALVARELRETLRLLLELEGRLRQGAHVAVAIVTNPEWIAIRTRLLRALEPFPEAQRAVVNALSEVSAR